MKMVDLRMGIRHYEQQLLIPDVRRSSGAGHHRQSLSFIMFAAKSHTKSMIKVGKNQCSKCKGEGAIECPGCKGTGKNKKNGNIFERWKCFDCQGFGLRSCPACGKGGAGLTPEQRGER